MNEHISNNLQLNNNVIENNNSKISTILNSYIYGVVDLIITNYNLYNEKDNIQKLVSEHFNNLNVKLNRKKKEINDDERCKGRKIDGFQCSRRCKCGKDFCGSHLKNLTYGSINDGKILTIKEKGKRGRKKKEVNNNSNFIETWIDMDIGKDYLVDKNNLVYSNNLEYPELIGIKINKSIQYINEIPPVLFL